MSDAFRCEDWVLITDKSDDAARALTDQQLKILGGRGCETIPTVDCSTENAPESICGAQGVPSFPTMCNRATQKCTSGLNETDAHFSELTTS